MIWFESFKCPQVHRLKAQGTAEEWWHPLGVGSGWGCALEESVGPLFSLAVFAFWLLCGDRSPAPWCSVQTQRVHSQATTERCSEAIKWNEVPPVCVGCFGQFVSASQG